MDGTDVLILILRILFGLFVVPFLFMLIWNNIIPQVCRFTEITFWQSFFLGIGLRLINGSIGINNKLDKE